MMPCDQDVSRKRFQRSPSLENLDEFSIEHQQQTLLDLSLGKLHQEQAQPIEPCLLKSVLISNAVRALQHHMFTATMSPSVEVITEVKEDSETTNFIVNTFNSSDYCFTPSSPIAPQKFPKLDSSFECSPLTLTQQATDEGFVHSLLPVTDESSDFLKSNIHPFFSHKCTSAHTSYTSSVHCINIENHATETVTVNGNSSVEEKCELSSEARKCSSEPDSNFDSMDTSLSPLDLKGIDPLLYDFDARTPPMLPSPCEMKVGHFSSCSVAANVTSAIDDNSKDMESDPSVLLDEIVNMLIET